MFKVFPLLLAISPVLISQLIQLGLIGIAVAGITVLSIFLIKRAIKKRKIRQHGLENEKVDQQISTQDLTKQVEHTDTKLSSLKVICYNDQKKKLKTENTSSVGSRSKESITKFREGVASALSSLSPDKMMYGVTMEIKGTNKEGKAKSPVVVKFAEMSTNRDAKLQIINAVGRLCMDTAATTSEVKAGKGYITKEIIDNILAWTEKANSNDVLDASKIDLSKSPEEVLSSNDDDLVVDGLDIREEGVDEHNDTAEDVVINDDVDSTKNDDEEGHTPVNDALDDDVDSLH